MNEISLHPNIISALNVWLKFGSVFLIYRLFTYFFIDNCQSDFFDKETLRLAIFILIGFTIYFLLIEPIFFINAENPILRNLGNDMLMFGTVLISSHLMDVWMNQSNLFSKEWFRAAAIILMSFAIYDIIIYPFIPYPGTQCGYLTHDWTKYGTFLIAFRLLQGKNFNLQYVSSIIFVLAGFAIYHLFVHKKFNFLTLNN